MMGERVTIELDTDLLEQARDLARRQELTLEAFLVQSIAQAIDEPAAYTLHVLRNSGEMAAVLLKTLKEHKAAEGDSAWPKS